MDVLVNCFIYKEQIARGQVIVAIANNHDHDHNIHHNCSTLGMMGSPFLDKYDKWGDVIGVQAGAS